MWEWLTWRTGPWDCCASCQHIVSGSATAGAVTNFIHVCARVSVRIMRIYARAQWIKHKAGGIDISIIILQFLSALHSRISIWCQSILHHRNQALLLSCISPWRYEWTRCLEVQQATRCEGRECAGEHRWREFSRHSLWGIRWES